MKPFRTAGVGLALCSVLVACDSAPSPEAGAESTDTGGATTSTPAESSAPSWTGAFRYEQRVDDLFLTVRLVVTPERAEYSVNSTRNGELFIQQTCAAPLTVANGTPIISTFDCEISGGGNRMSKAIAFDLSFNGVAWVKRDSGEETILTRI